MSEVHPLVKVGAAFVAGGLATYFVGDAILRKRDALVNDGTNLHERVRVRIAELVSYPDAIEVQVDGGLVRVSGRVLVTDVDRLLSQLTQVPRVYRVYNALVAVDDPTALTRGSGAARDAHSPL